MNITIRLRIIILILLTFTAIAAIGGFAILQARANAAEVKRVTEEVVPSALASADLVSQLKDIQLAIRALVSESDANLVVQAKSALDARKSQLKASLVEQLGGASDNTQKGIIAQAGESLTNYFSAIDDTAALKVAGQKALAEANLYATVGEYQRELGGIVDTLRVEKRRTADAAIGTLNDNLTKTATTITLTTVVTLVLLTIGFMLLYRQVTVPISRMQAMMSEIADSQDYTRRVPVERDDEIGRSISAFNAMIARIEESSALLQQKTNDMQTMLHNMPQGILTVMAGNKIHPEYSAYLEQILETQEIAGRDLMEVVFANTNLGVDMLAQVEAVAGACIGEDAMNFEFNEHLMVGEIERRVADGSIKILDLSWSPIVNEQGITERLLICVRDITELRRLAAEANQQKRELEIIGEILAVSQEKFFEFTESAAKLLEDNERLIHEHPTQDAEVINHLFRNMHTVKGNARTYALRNLTNTVHEAEQTYDELRKKFPNIVWDQASLLAELATVKEAVAHYAHINEVMLGRKGPGRRGNMDRFLLVERRQIEASLHRLESVNTANLHELLAARDAVRHTLKLLGTEPIAEMLSGVFDSLPSLALELKKVPPVIEIDDGGYFLRNQIAGMLKNVFMHLVRNAVDHGLEPADERLSKGKSPAGTIRLALALADGRLRMRLSDDGRGLALGRIRSIAVNKGLLAVKSNPTDEEIASQVFRAGFTTAAEVTEVSGRGVGLDAVVSFIKHEGGNVEFRFLDDAVGSDFRRFETVVSLPDSFAVHVDPQELAAARMPHPGDVASAHPHGAEACATAA